MIPVDKPPAGNKDFKGIMRQFKRLVLISITEEPELPGDMPDGMWDDINGNRDVTNHAMQNVVRLTKNGITERFLKYFTEIERRLE